MEVLPMPELLNPELPMLEELKPPCPEDWDWE